MRRGVSRARMARVRVNSYDECVADCFARRRIGVMAVPLSGSEVHNACFWARTHNARGIGAFSQVHTSRNRAEWVKVERRGGISKVTNRRSR